MHPAPRPPHRQPRLLALVLIGGAVGAPLRYLIARSLPTAANTWPVSTFVINLGGAFALGLLLESLLRRGPDTGSRRGLRLLLGTGVLGAFTTYSTLATETDLLIQHGHAGLGTAYCCASVALGVLAAALGVGAARAVPVRGRG